MIRIAFEKGEEVSARLPFNVSVARYFTVEAYLAIYCAEETSKLI